MEQSCLAGAVGADDRMTLAHGDVQRHAADDRRRAEALVQVVQRKRGVHAPALPLRCRLTVPQASVTIGQSRRPLPTPAVSSASATSQGKGELASTLKPNKDAAPPSPGP